MKFNNNQFFKHTNCKDVFIQISSITIDDNNKAIIWASWMIQGIDHYRYASNIERIFIKSNEYDNWKPYTPEGSPYYV